MPFAYEFPAEISDEQLAKAVIDLRTGGKIQATLLGSIIEKMWKAPAGLVTLSVESISPEDAREAQKRIGGALRGAGRVVWDDPQAKFGLLRAGDSYETLLFYCTEEEQRGAEERYFGRAGSGSPEGQAALWTGSGLHPGANEGVRGTDPGEGDRREAEGRDGGDGNAGRPGGDQSDVHDAGPGAGHAGHREGSRSGHSSRRPP